MDRLVNERVPGTRYQVLTWYQVPGTRVYENARRFLGPAVPRTRVPGTNPGGAHHNRNCYLTSTRCSTNTSRDYRIVILLWELHRLFQLTALSSSERRASRRRELRKTQGRIIPVIKQSLVLTSPVTYLTGHNKRWRNSRMQLRTRST